VVDGIVILNGRVATPQQKAAAVRIAKAKCTGFKVMDHLMTAAPSSALVQKKPATNQ